MKTIFYLLVAILAAINSNCLSMKMIDTLRDAKDVDKEIQVEYNCPRKEYTGENVCEKQYTAYYCGTIKYENNTCLDLVVDSVLANRKKPSLHIYIPVNTEHLPKSTDSIAEILMKNPGKKNFFMVERKFDRNKVLDTLEFKIISYQEYYYSKSIPDIDTNRLVKQPYFAFDGYTNKELLLRQRTDTQDTLLCTYTLKKEKIRWKKRNPVYFSFLGIATAAVAIVEIPLLPIEAVAFFIAWKKSPKFGG